jgi:ATP phosphoribosyltransferase
MLREAGYLRSHHPRDLVVQDPENDAEFFFLRPRDIATYVGSGTLDLGITGRDMLLDSGAPASELMQLGFGGSNFRLAVPADQVAAGVDSLEGKRIATSYPGILEKWLADRGISAKLIKLEGAVENAVNLGVADAVADVVDTGTTLRQAGLVVIGEAILTSEAVLIRRTEAPDERAIDNFVRRLEGVIVARTYVMVDYDVPIDLVPQAVAITPGIESPTVSPLHDTKWAAVRAMVPRRDVHIVMDDLHDLGAKGVIVTDIHAARL